MSREISQKSQHELTQAVGTRYQAARRVEKTQILDEFVRISGYHRKHGIRLLCSEKRIRGSGEPRPQRRVYDEAVRQALIVLWEASDRICGKRLKPLLPLLIDSLTKHGHLELDDEVHRKLLAVSHSTIDRILMPIRGASSMTPRRKPPAVRSKIPVRTFADWNDPPPGFLEIDLVSHCGGVVSGSFNHTLTLTDISSGWTECVALAVRDSSLIVRALEEISRSMPFDLKGIDTDNGTEFINESVFAFASQKGIELTRSRPYKKNDQAWVEQKNGSIVRRMVGYGRLEGLVGAESLARLYSSSRLFVNFFQPSFKLLSKERIGSRVRKKYETPATPCARLLACESIEEHQKERLRAVLATLDPLQLLDEIRTMQAHLASLAAGSKAYAAPSRNPNLDRFLASLESAWKGGEIRPTHKGKPREQRQWRTRKDPFEFVWPELVGWLGAEPDMIAKDILDRLQKKYPGVYKPGQIRTLQRRVKLWRAHAARQLIFVDPEPPKSSAATRSPVDSEMLQQPEALVSDGDVRSIPN